MSGYNVYEAPDGCAETFLGFVETIDEAHELAAKGGGLEESLYETARKAGHCGGLTAPDKSHEADEPSDWFGPKGWHCAVPVLSSNNHPNRNLKRRLRDAAEAEAIKIAGKYCIVKDPGNRPVIDMAREAYMLGFEAGRKSNRRTT